jgi:hypothetical protein
MSRSRSSLPAAVSVQVDLFVDGADFDGAAHAGGGDAGGECDGGVEVGGVVEVVAVDGADDRAVRSFEPAVVEMLAPVIGGS